METNGEAAERKTKNKTAEWCVWRYEGDECEKFERNGALWIKLGKVRLG